MLRFESRAYYRLRLLFFFFRNFFHTRTCFFFSAVRASFMSTDRPQWLARAGVPFIARGLVTSARPPGRPPTRQPVRQPAHLSVRRSVGRGDKDSVDALPPSRAQRFCSLFVSWKVPFIFFFSFHVLLRLFFFCFSRTGFPYRAKKRYGENKIKVIKYSFVLRHKKKAPRYARGRSVVL